MKVFDCFCFTNETELLEIRLHELADVVDYHVIAEATVSHNGEPRELGYDPSDPRWAPFRDRVLHVVVDDLPSEVDAWGRENLQRMAILRALDAPGPDGRPICGPLDIVFISDADEIPQAGTITSLRNSFVHGVANFEMMFSYYHVNQWAYAPDEDDQPGQPSGRWVRAHPSNRAAVVRRCEMTSPQRVTNTQAEEFARTFPSAGWHLSYLGGPERISAKIKRMAHQEYNTPEFSDPAKIAERIERGDDLFDRNWWQRFATVPLDESFPRLILGNPERYAHLVKGGLAAFDDIIPAPSPPDPQTWMPDVWEWLIENYQPTSVLEYGSADGTNLRAFADLGARVLGVERQRVNDVVGPGRTVAHDFASGPWQPPREFDLCLCTGFVQRLAPEHEANWAAGLSRSRVLVLAHPLPGDDPWQRDADHWIRLVERAGFVLDVPGTEGLQGTFAFNPHAPLRQTLLLFVRSAIASGPGWPAGVGPA